jgi:cyanophycinase-like exopeptidase
MTFKIASLFVPVRAFLVVGLGLLASQTVWAGKSYSYYSVGNPDFNVSIQNKPTVPSAALVGGGYDVAEVFRWMITQGGVRPANCTTGTPSSCSPTSGGRFLILRATGTNAYNPYIFSRLGTIDPTTPKGYENVGGVDLGLSSVETLIVPSRTGANDPKVVALVQRADAIWIAGGNQADYINFWKGTALNSALNAKIAANTPIGGTSAGTAILGQFVFAALNGTVTSKQALADPFNKYMSFDPVLSATSVQPGLLKIAALANTITDDHVDTRDRMGRTVAFISRVTKQICAGPAEVAASRAIALDEETALIVSGSQARVVSNPNYQKTTTNTPNPNSAYFLNFSAGYNSICMAGKPLTLPISTVFLTRMTGSQAFATTTANSLAATPLAAGQNVSYTDIGKYFDLSSWLVVPSAGAPAGYSTSYSVGKDVSAANGILSGTTY